MLAQELELVLRRHPDVDSADDDRQRPCLYRRDEILEWVRARRRHQVRALPA